MLTGHFQEQLASIRLEIMQRKQITGNGDSSSSRSSRQELCRSYLEHEIVCCHSRFDCMQRGGVGFQTGRRGEDARQPRVGVQVLPQRRPSDSTATATAQWRPNNPAAQQNMVSHMQINHTRINPATTQSNMLVIILSISQSIQAKMIYPWICRHFVSQQAGQVWPGVVSHRGSE